MKKWTFTIPADPAPNSPNRTRRLHWGKRARIGADLRMAGWLAWQQAGRPRAFGAIGYSVTITRPRLLDDDNALSACKPILDGLLSGALVRDDSRKWARLEKVSQVKGRPASVTVKAWELWGMKERPDAYDIADEVLP